MNRNAVLTSVAAFLLVVGAGWRFVGIGRAAPPAEPAAPKTASLPVTRWPKYRCDSKNTGQSKTAFKGKGRIAWRMPTVQGLYSSPAVDADGSVYLGTGNYDDDETVPQFDIFAISASRKRKWSFKVKEACVRSSPTVSADGLMYIGADNGKLYAIRLQDGVAQWEFDTGRYVRGSSALDANKGYVYVMSGSGYLFALNASTGREIWRAFVGEPYDACPAVSQDTVFVSAEGTLFALDANTGKTKWTSTGSRDMSSCPVIGDGVVYIIKDYYHLVALNQKDGSQKWSVRTVGFCEGPNLSAQGRLYVTGRNEKRGTSVVAYDAAKGTRLWRVDAPFTYPPNHSAPCLDANGNVYTGLEKYFVALDGKSGKRLWRLAVPNGYVSTAPAITPDGQIIVGVTTTPGSPGGYVMAIN